ncbi:MAG: carboxypeptidase regulatory-like domain-containing protein [Methanomassiliicoccaceae archaeon]|nr:carboxypeptidase regulatory-like domain-containing protein [Methanomassiliicoccaceae archaeon]
MRKFGKAKSSQETEKRVLAAKDGGEGSWIKRHWLPLTLLLIVALAIAVRTVFSFGISAGSNFALSGSGSSEHQHTIENILTGAFGLSDPSLNYPYGGTSVQPPLVDFILAFFAWIAMLLGVSVPTAAAGALAFSGPVAAAITCVLVYILGKEMFDRTVGLVSALLFATLPLPIVMSVFSNGNEMSIVLMFFVAAMLFMVRAMNALDSNREAGIKGAFGKGVLKYTVPAGLLVAAIALSWNGFRMIIVMLVFLMVAQAVFARLKGRDFGAVLGSYLTMIIIGLAASVPYYVAAGLFFAVFTGPLTIAAISAACVGLFYVFRARPRIQSMLIPVIVAAVALVVLYLATPWLFNDVVSGNQIYETPLLAAILLPQHISISYMATFYGWATVWMPFVIFAYMLYRFGKKAHSEAYLMSMLWIIGVFVLSWLSFESAIIAGAMYSIAAAVVIVKLIRGVDMKTYLATIRGGGFKASLKKFLKPEPFISFICILLLIVAPNAMLAADASTSTNQESDMSTDYLGGLGYSINTEESDPMNKIWDTYSTISKDGAIVTWFQDSSAAVDKGGFVSLTSDSGQGASAASNIILAEGSEGALAAMAMRLIIADGTGSYSDLIDAAGLGDLESLINDPAACRDTILNNPDIYSGVSGDISDENAVYIRTVQYITDNLTEPEVIAFYNDICDERGDGGISYVALNAGMIPLYYGDGSSISTLAYLNDYSADSNGAYTKFFTYGYTGVSYTDAMYESFLWKAIFGVTDESSGVTSLAYDLVYSDGTVTAQPGLGLSGFEVEYWQVKYNPDGDAELNDDGWVYMDGYEAIELQKTNGGLINYFSSIVLLKVSDTSEETAVSGQLTYNGGTPLEGAKVAVFEEDENGTFVQRSTSFTGSDGIYSIMVPTSGNYEIRVYTGTDLTVGGTFVETITDPAVATDITASTISGTVTGVTSSVKVTATGLYSGTSVTVDSNASGEYTFPAMPSDKYTLTATLGTYTLGTQTVTIYPGNNSGIDIEPEGEISVTVTDQYGAPLKDIQVVAQSLLDGSIYEATALTDVYGKVDISVMSSITGVTYSGQYVVYAKDKVGTSSSATVSTSTVSAKITVYGDVETGSGMTGIITVMAPGYSSVNATSGVANLPSIGDSTFTLYDGSVVKTYDVESGTYTDIGSVVDFTATLMSSSGEAISGTVTFFGDNGVTMGYTADDEGNISGKLPAGDYTVCAVGSDGSCLIKTVTITAGADLGELETGDGRKLTVTLTFSSGTDGQKGLAFREVKVTLGTGEVIYGMTNSEGKAVIQIPDGVTAEILIAGSSDSAMTWSDLTKSIAASTENATASFNIGTVTGSTVNSQSITPTDNTWLLTSATSDTADYEIAAGASAAVAPGTYFCIEENAGVYTYSEVKVYAGAGHNTMYTVADTKVENMSKVEVPALTGATVTVTADPDNEDAEYYEVNLGTGYYLLESGKYLFKAETDTQVAYAYYDGSALDNPAWTLKDAVTLKGYVGVAGSGTAVISASGQTLFASVSDGAYEIEVPGDIGAVTITFDVTKTISSSEYSYTGSVNATIDSTKTNTVNAELTGDGISVADSDAALTIEVDASTLAPSADGTFSFTLDVTPSVDSTGTKTYAVSAVGPWQLDKSYTVTVDGSGAETVEVWGWLDPLKVGDGDPEMKVSLTDLNGTTQATCQMPSGYVVDIAAVDNVTVMVATDDGASSDAVNDYEYMYAVTIRNDANYMMYAKLTVTGVPSGWLYTVSDGDGKLISADSTTKFPVAGYAYTTVYVKLISVDGSSTEIPEINIKVEVSPSSGSPVTTVEFDVTKQDAVLESSVSASGDNVYQTGNAVQNAFWILLLLSVVLIVMIVWLGSKRGVFRRRK